MTSTGKLTQNWFPADQLKARLPQIEKRKALLVIDAQEDFLSTSGRFAVKSPLLLAENIRAIVSKFRKHGQVVWVKSEFDNERLVNDSRRASDSIILDEQVAQFRALRSKASALPSIPDEVKTSPARSVLENCSREEIPTESIKCMAPARSATGPSFNNLDDEAFLSFTADGSAPSVCLPQSKGADFAKCVLSEVKDQDEVIVKTHYSAFRSTSLLSYLRGSVVTEIFVCGLLSNISVYATALDAGKHGFAITILEDCVGYQKEERHEAALSKMVEYMGVNLRKSTHLLVGANAAERMVQYDSRNRIRSTSSNNEVESQRLRSRSKRSKPSKKFNKSSIPQDIEIQPNDSEGGVKLALNTKGGRSTLNGIPSKHIEDNSLHDDSAFDDSVKTPDSEQTEFPIKDNLQEPAKDIYDLNILDTDLKNLHLHLHPHPTLQVLDAVSLEDAAQKPPTPTTDTKIAMAQAIHPVKPHRVSRTHTRGQSLQNVSPDDIIAEGDSKIIYGLLPPSLDDDAFEKIKKEVKWQTMFHRGGEVPRLVAVEGEINEDGSFPIYRHPADESPPLLPFSSTISLIRNEVEKAVKHPVNHVLIQHYRNGNDNISEHSDKTLDIVRGSSIVNVSLGAQRTMTLRTKKSALDPETKPSVKAACQDSEVDKAARNPSLSHAPNKSNARGVQRVLMPHNSMFVLGGLSNMKWLHGIRPDKRPESMKSAEESAYSGERISLTFRHIGTYLSRDSTKIWGQGSTFKHKDCANSVINGNGPEAEQMIRAFGAENHRSEFDWDAEYGNGFDVLNIVTAIPKLFTSGDLVSDFRVKMCLAEKNIKWDTKSTPAPNSAMPMQIKSSCKLVDCDAERSEVEGDLAILFYLETCYTTNALMPSTKQQSAVAAAYSQVFASNHLRHAWQDARLILDDIKPSEAAKFLMSRRVQQDRKKAISPFLEELQTWENELSDMAFVATVTFTIADCAFWPVLHEIAREWIDWSESQYPALARYLKRVSERESIKLMLNDHANHL